MESFTFLLQCRDKYHFENFDGCLACNVNRAIDNGQINHGAMEYCRRLEDIVESSRKLDSFQEINTFLEKNMTAVTDEYYDFIKNLQCIKEEDEEEDEDDDERIEDEQEPEPFASLVDV